MRIVWTATVGLLLALPAFADTRDEVVQGILRCATITDDRNWLDCTYGAQQPMRTKRGLPRPRQSQQERGPHASAQMIAPMGGSVFPAPAEAARPSTADAPIRHARPNFMQVLT